MNRKIALIAILGASIASAHQHAHPHFKHTGGASRPALPAGANIEVRDNYRYLTATGLPDHVHGAFPNGGNPNPIVPQDKTYRMPLKPEKAAEPTGLGLIAFGVAINGVPFEPSAAEYWKSDRNSGWQYEALSGKLDLGLDVNHAHVQPTGKYHYHGVPTGLMKTTKADRTTVLIGYAADGYPMYGPIGYSDPLNPKSPLKRLLPSYQLKQGNRPAEPQGPGGTYDGTFVQDYQYVGGSGDLDEFNGRFGATREYPTGTYYYVVTEAFPFIPRAFRGTPDDSFRFGRSTPGADRGAGRERPFGRPERQGLQGPPDHHQAKAQDPSALLMHRDFGRWLSLNETQSRQVYELTESIRKTIETGREGPADREPEEIRNKMRAAKAHVAKQMNSSLPRILTPKQQIRWKELVRQQQGDEYLLSAEAKAKLRLSDTQISKIYTAIVMARTNDDNPSPGTKSPKELLSPSQQRSLEDLLGPSIHTAQISRTERVERVAPEDRPFRQGPQGRRPRRR